MVDVCDTFCGVETFAAALEMDQMDQMNQSALEPQKKVIKHAWGCGTQLHRV